MQQQQQQQQQHHQQHQQQQQHMSLQQQAATTAARPHQLPAVNGTVSAGNEAGHAMNGNGGLDSKEVSVLQLPESTFEGI